MKKKLKPVLVFICIVLLTGCNILDSESSKISPLDSKINFKIIESYDHYEAVSIPDIFIELETEKIYECYNYGIATKVRVEDKSITLDINGIDKSGVCATALGPARASIKLGRISGIYEVNFQAGEISDKYNLLISDSLIILDGTETQSTKPQVRFMYRYPEKSFVFLCGTLLADSSLCNSFIDTLQSVINLTEFQFTDLAEIPYPKSSQGHQYDAEARFFYYESETDFDKISEVMKSFKLSYFPQNDGTGMQAINWMNKKILSWLL